MENKKSILREETIDFAVFIFELCEEIVDCSIYVNQLIRSSSSIGANVHEAKYAQSRADFVNKLEIALKECYETEYWLELIGRKNKISSENYKKAKQKSGAIRRKLISSITTAKENQEI